MSGEKEGTSCQSHDAVSKRGVVRSGRERECRIDLVGWVLWF